MVSLPPVDTWDSSIVVRRTFIEEVATPRAADGLGKRSCSDSALFQMSGQQHGQSAKDEAACAGKHAKDEEEEEVEFELCGLSDAGSVDTCPERLNDDDGTAGALPCYAHLQEVNEPQSPGAKSAREPKSLGGAAAPAPCSIALGHLLQENQRLALENQMLRENQRLAQENQLLRDCWVPAGAGFAAQSGAGSTTRMAVAPPGSWVLPLGHVAVPTADACAAQSAGAPADAPARAARRGRRRGAVPRPSAQRTAPPAALHTTAEPERTTVMMRNLPNNYSRSMLLELLDQEGFGGRYDFLYLPIDFKSSACLGYAFVNLVDPSVVPAFWSKFDGFSDWVLPSKKVCQVSWTGPHQGLDAHIDRYRNSPVMHPSVPDAYKPAVFKGGKIVPFPESTKATHAPRVRNKPPSDPDAPHGPRA